MKKRPHNYRKFVAKSITGRKFYVQRTPYSSWFAGFWLWISAILFIASLTIDVLKPVKATDIPHFANIQGSTDNQVATPSAAILVPTKGWGEFVAAVDKIAPIYNFPKNVVLAQGALESAHGNSKFAQDRNNYLGIGAYDSDPEQAFHYENAEQCVIEYMRLIKKTFPEAWKNRDNPDALLHALKSNKKKMYASDVNYEQKVKAMKEWNYVSTH